MSDRIDEITSSLTSVRRIAVLRALQLGDFLVAVPALRALRARFPLAEITLIGLPWTRALLPRYRRYIDRFVEFAGYPGLDEVPVDAQRTQRFLAEQRDYGYDLVMQMHGSGGVSNPLAYELGGRITVGYYEGEFPRTLTIGAPYPHELHEIQRNLGLVALLEGTGGTRGTQLETQLEFPLFETDHAEAAALLRGLPRAERPWIALHPGSRPPARRWPAPYFAEVANELARRFSAQIILTGGPGEETTVQDVFKRLDVPALNLVGQTSLGGLAALISKVDLFISNDTGPAHISHAFDSPSITIFGPADQRRWAPLDRTRHPIVRQPVPCSPCGYWTCPIDHRCLRWISPARVIRLACSLLPAYALAAQAHQSDPGLLVRVESNGESICND